MMTHNIVTFGCRLNNYESDIIRSKLSDADLKDVTIFNSCAVTNEAERQLMQAIRKEKNLNPKNKIIVTGCAAQTSPKKYSAMREVDYVIGNKEKLLLSSYSDIKNAIAAKEQISNVFEDNLDSSDQINSSIINQDSTILKQQGRARAFLQIQNGCNHRCTFCLIPYGRGNNKSVSIQNIIDIAEKMVKSNYNEIVLTGVDITDYGKDLPGKPSITQMIKRLLFQIPNLKRLRLSSVDVAELVQDEEFLDIFGSEKRIMPHLHLSLQSGNNMILKRMKRRHTREDAITFCEKIISIRSDVKFGADIIAGFPTETDDMFQDTKLLIKQIPITYLHVFPYSERALTPAAKMPQIPVKIRKERAAELRLIGDNILNSHLKSQIGKKVNAILENSNIARAEDFSQIKLQKDQCANLKSGHIIKCKINGVVENKYLDGDII